jgi:flagellar motor protein MotB
MTQQLADAQRLRQQLAQEGRDVSDLDRAIEGMRRLTEARAYGDPLEFVKLQSAVVDDVKQFEFNLRKQILGEQKEKLFMSGSADVPEGFRKLVEDYYKALSRNKKN